LFDFFGTDPLDNQVFLFVSLLNIRNERLRSIHHELVSFVEFVFVLDNLGYQLFFSGLKLECVDNILEHKASNIHIESRIRRRPSGSHKNFDLLIYRQFVLFLFGDSDIDNYVIRFFCDYSINFGSHRDILHTVRQYEIKIYAHELIIEIEVAAIERRVLFQNQNKSHIGVASGRVNDLGAIHSIESCNFKPMTLGWDETYACKRCECLLRVGNLYIDVVGRLLSKTFSRNNPLSSFLSSV